MNIKTSAPTPQAFLWPASLHVMSFFDSSIIQSSLCCHYEYYNHRSCLFCYRPTIIAVIYIYTNVWSQLFGAGVNYPGFISQKDLLCRDRIYIHAITINLSGPGCIQSFWKTLITLKSWEWREKWKIALWLCSSRSVFLCATLSVLSPFRHFVSASLSNLLIQLKARANLLWAEDGRVQQRGAERCWTSWRKQPRRSTYHVAVLVHMDFVVTVVTTEHGI